MILLLISWTCDITMDVILLCKQLENFVSGVSRFLNDSVRSTLI